jgi:hypothetical protein
MISRRVPQKPESDNYRRLARYIAAADHQDEKSYMSWCAGCLGDDYALGIQEALDTQAMNKRSAKEKTYHLIVSFRPEDEARLNPEVFKLIEEEFAKALGFADHQRHVGVHKNTNNLHMHVAYNMIHPERLTRHEPYRDYHKRDLVCRELERRFGLAIDNGRGIQKDGPQLRDVAAMVEAHTGQQSFERYAKDRRGLILEALDHASSWEDLHGSLAKLGMGIAPHGNGLVLQDVHNARRAVKASAVDRELSRARLGKRFGPYVAPNGHHPENERYKAKPLHRGAARGELFREYQAGREMWIAALDAVAKSRNAKMEALRARWESERRNIRLTFVGREQRRLLKAAQARETEERSRIQQDARAAQKQAREETPYSSWTDFLRWQATKGQEAALAILRSNDTDNAHINSRVTHEVSAEDQKTQGLSVREKWARTQKELLTEEGLSRQGLKGLLILAKARELAELEGVSPESPKLFSGFMSEIDARGVVMIRLQGGGMVRDDGRNILFSMHDDQARDAALQLAQAKWGKAVGLDGNVLRFLPRDRVKENGLE